METARVDIRKLQLLNDRISQCLDALAQVRLSVHGLSQSGSPTAGIGSIGASGPTQGFAPLQQLGGQPFQQPPLQQQPFQQQPFQQQPFQQQPFQQQQQPFQQPPFQQPQQPPFQQPQQQLFQQQPFFGQPFGAQPQGGYWQANGGQMPGWGTPTPTPSWGAMGGLSHTGQDLEALYGRPLWADPALSARVRETFPYAGYTLPPFISLL